MSFHVLSILIGLALGYFFGPKIRGMVGKLGI